MKNKIKEANKKSGGFLEGFTKAAGSLTLGPYFMPSFLKRESETSLSSPYNNTQITGAFTGYVAGGLAVGSQLTQYFISEFQASGYEALEPLAWTNGASLAIETGASIYNKFKEKFKNKDVPSQLEEAVESGKIEKKAS